MKVRDFMIRVWASFINRHYISDKELDEIRKEN